MDELDKLRIEIDSIDRDILDAFERRIAVSRRIGNAKRANGIEVFDAAREEVKLKQIREAAGFESAPYAEDLFRNLMGYAKIHMQRTSSVTSWVMPRSIRTNRHSESWESLCLTHILR